MAKHLVILKKTYLDKILDGSKTIESRFTKTKRSPFGQIFRGDEIFFKISSGPVCATAAVAKVKCFENLSPLKIAELKEKYNSGILGADNYWLSKSDCGFGVLVWLKNVRLIESVSIDKKDLRAWVVLTEQRNFGLLKE